jgi:quinol monooxygenase YgiN
MTGNRRELGGSFAFGPWHVRRAKYGAIQLAGDGVFGPRAEELGTVLCLCPLIGRHRKGLEAGAVSELQGIGRFKFHEVGKLEEFKRLSAQAMEIVRAKDTGTLQYEIYFSDDQSECIVLERYQDSEALLEHAANLGELGGAILATGLVSSELLGEPGAELRAKLADGPVRLFTPFLSM